MMAAELLRRYFPDLSDRQIDLFNQLEGKYRYWNERINLVSRKDMDQLMIHHILHSLAIAKFIEFKPGSSILDVGTGGGLPGIPLAIFYPETKFYLVDSIGKKIKVVLDIAESLQLSNLSAEQARAETLKHRYDFIVTRAVAPMPQLIEWVGNKLKTTHHHDLRNGIIALKGGDLTEELKQLPSKVVVKDIPDFFQEAFFETKKIVYWN